MANSAAIRPRWELYKLLGEPLRLRLLALASLEELAIGEMAELTQESQPNVSRHAKALREAGLLAGRKQGTRTFLKLADPGQNDAVIADALRAGRLLCTDDGSIARVPAIVRARDAASRAFFDRAKPGATADLLPPEVPAYLTAIAALVEHRNLAVDAGTGDGSLLDVLAPIYQKVIGIDRAAAQLDRARARVESRGYAHVDIHAGEIGDSTLHAQVHAHGGADAVFGARMLHHAPVPTQTLRELARLARPGGAIIIIDYAAHQDERMREDQADLWLGFDAQELTHMAHGAGLVDVRITPIPSGRCGEGPDRHLNWQILTARTEKPNQTTLK